ncbi:UDP-3-O-[3-hydroxymyristoyl] glucosamine N-acyltransferase [Salegentibacter sp. 24]|uniref:DapH/DapD/GlmU-related protein n=1 Tax=Salegentibacter sp. 24 TaxID=2183986 RepID=UPI001061784C|nr:DapH/DapD/GlmU-related protein [Salegentibacter sp. 24]TDN89144.1 UDP-3-O-[3-hydroxymyristoyl] glucosamine N-acyltransferase [Salegentibacter sp. 24]
MKISFVDIKIFLNKHGIPFQVIGDAKENYIVASIYNPVKNGFYFLQASNDIPNFSDSIILTDFINKPFNGNVILKINESPQVVFYKILNEYFKEVSSGEVCSSSKIHNEAIIGKNVQIDSFVVIGISEIGDNSIIKSNTVINDNCKIGKNTIIESNCSIGVRGIAWVFEGQGNRVNQPQLGGVTIGENCIIGANSAIARGSLNEDTRIGDQTVIAPGAKIGHGVIISERVHLSNNVCVAGNSKIEERSFIGSGAIISSKTVIKKGTIVGAGAMVNKNFEKENSTLIGVPARPVKKEKRNINKGVPATLRNIKDEE